MNVQFDPTRSAAFPSCGKQCCIVQTYQCCIIVKDAASLRNQTDPEPGLIEPGPDQNFGAGNLRLGISVASNELFFSPV